MAPPRFLAGLQLAPPHTFLLNFTFKFV